MHIFHKSFLHDTKWKTTSIKWQEKPAQTSTIKKCSSYDWKKNVLHRRTLTCATHPSTNPCCCSSPIWKPSKWLSASPVSSSRQWQRSVKYSVSVSYSTWLQCPIWPCCCCCYDFVWNILDISFLIVHTFSSLFHLRHQEARGTVPAEASRWSLQEEEEERQELCTAWHMGHRIARIIRYYEIHTCFLTWPAAPNDMSKAICGISEKIQANTQEIMHQMEHNMMRNPYQ